MRKKSVFVLCCVVAVTIAFTIFVQKKTRYPFPYKNKIIEAEQAVADLDSAVFERLLPLHKVKTPPGPYDWMAVHKEPGQTFTDFVQSQPVQPDAQRQYIYIQMLGEFDQKQNEVLEKTARFVEVYFQLPVRYLPQKDYKDIPKRAQRVHPQTFDQQVLSTYVIEELLIPSLPADAFCLIAFSSADLWPGEGWNFVFGQASLPDRVGVWSIYRNGDPNKSQEDYEIFLKRTIKTAVHEIGHMFGMHHCLYFECLLNGSNHRQEADQRPLWLCPVCLRKFLWNRDIAADQRFEQLRQVCEDLAFPQEVEYYHTARQFFKNQ